MAEALKLDDVHIDERIARGYLSVNVGGEAIATIYWDGKVVIAEDRTPDDAAKAFWAAVEHLNPLRQTVERQEKEIERLNDLLIKVQIGG
jgi:acyl-CoA synthetase (NDP forming)